MLGPRALFAFSFFFLLPALWMHTNHINRVDLLLSRADPPMVTAPVVPCQGQAGLCCNSSGRGEYVVVCHMIGGEVEPHIDCGVERLLLLTLLPLLLLLFLVLAVNGWCL